LDMYDGLGYGMVEHGWFGVRDTTILLRKGGLGCGDLEEEVIVSAGATAGNETSVMGVDEKDLRKSQSSAYFLDYMV